MRCLRPNHPGSCGRRRPRSVACSIRLPARAHSIPPRADYPPQYGRVHRAPRHMTGRWCRGWHTRGGGRDNRRGWCSCANCNTNSLQSQYHYNNLFHAAALSVIQIVIIFRCLLLTFLQSSVTIYSCYRTPPPPVRSTSTSQPRPRSLPAAPSCSTCRPSRLIAPRTCTASLITVGSA